jgi:hypothetical protein
MKCYRSTNGRMEWELCAVRAQESCGLIPNQEASNGSGCNERSSRGRSAGNDRKSIVAVTGCSLQNIMCYMVKVARYE